MLIPGALMTVFVRPGFNRARTLTTGFSPPYRLASMATGSRFSEFPVPLSELR